MAPCASAARSAYVRSDNADALSALVADRRLKSLGLHRIAETVVICHAPTSEVITALRGAGYAPAAESPDGAVVIRRPEDRRTRAPRSAAVTTRRPPEDALVTAAVRTLRAGDKASAPRAATVVGPASRAELPSLSSAAIVSSLRGALADQRAVWIGYADTDGAVGQQIVDPIRLHGRRPHRVRPPHRQRASVRGVASDGRRRPPARRGLSRLPSRASAPSTTR